MGGFGRSAKMDFDSIRPIISGLIGGVIAIWLGAKCARYLPHSKSVLKQEALVSSQRKVIRRANIGVGVSIFVGPILYFGGILDSQDWRGLGLMAGLAALLPLLIIVVSNFRGGTDGIQSGLNAFALSQKIPTPVLFYLLGLMLLGGLWAGLAFFIPE